MRRYSSMVAVLVIGGWSLACGGLWQEALSESFTEMTVTLHSTVPPGPERDRVQAVLDEGFLQTRAGNVGLFELVAFEEAFDAALMDGVLTPTEATGLEAAAAKQDFPVLDPSTLTEEERAERELELSIKRMLDEAAASDPFGVGSLGYVEDDGDTDLPDAPTASFAGWDVRTVSKRIKGAGWSIDECHEETYDGLRYLTCTAEREGLYAGVSITRHNTAEEARWSTVQAPGVAARRDGAEALVVTVYDGERAQRVQQALLPAGAKLTDLAQARVQEQLAADGWTVDSCDAFFDAYSEGFGCTVEAGRVVGSVDLYVDKETEARGGGDDRTVRYGIAEVLQGPASLTVEVLDGGSAEVLITALVGS